MSKKTSGRVAKRAGKTGSKSASKDTIEQGLLAGLSRGHDLALDLYELCVTNAGALARFAAAIHEGGGDSGRKVKGKKKAAKKVKSKKGTGLPVRVLREDFCGSGSLARAWGMLYGEGFGVDQDPKALAHGMLVDMKVRGDLVGIEEVGGKGFSVVASDVQECGIQADIIAATNFPLGYFHTRDGLLKYLKHSKRCLKPGGVFFADMYGGSDAFMTGKQKRIMPGEPGERIEYTWEQVSAHKVTGIVKNAIHFEIKERGKKAMVLNNAFTYHWRLWGIRELCDAMLEAGFVRVEVYHRLMDGMDAQGDVSVKPVWWVDQSGEGKPGDMNDDPWVMYVVGRI